MYILIDMSLRTAELAEAEDFHTFHLAVANSAEDEPVEAVLESEGVGRLDPDDDEHAWVSVGWVRRAAVRGAKPHWGDHFDKMLEHAAKKGWLSDDKELIRAHVEWIDEEG